MADQNYVNQFTMIANSAMANYFTGRRQAMAEEQEKRLMQDLSLRERMFQAQQSQWDQDYTLRYRQIGLQEEQQKLNEKVQNSNMEVQRRASVDFEADSYAAPVFASIAGELQSLSGDPSAILNYQPDLTELDKLDPDIARRAKSKVLVQFQPYRDQLLAASDELKEASATGQALLKGAPYLNTVENYGTGASLRAKQIGRKILRRQELTPDEEQLAIDYYDVIARESSKRDPKLIETKTKLSGQLVVENLKSAVAEYQAASKTYNDTLNNMTATDSAKKSAQEELELAKANLRSAKLMAGIKQNIFEEGSEPEQVETQAEEPKANKGSPETQRQAMPNLAPATETPSSGVTPVDVPIIRNILPPLTPIKYPPRPGQRPARNSINVLPKNFRQTPVEG